MQHEDTLVLDIPAPEDGLGTCKFEGAQGL